MQNLASIQGVQDAIYLCDKRDPVYKILLFDQTDTINKIVLGNYTQTPIDISNCVESCGLKEDEDSASTASLTIIPDYTKADPLTPYHFKGRRIIQIFYKDASTTEDYVSLFIGVCVGQPGYRRNRASNEETITVSCVDRSFFYNKRKCNSPDFPEGSDLGEVAVAIAENASYGMDLEREEIRFGLFRHVVEHTKITIYDIPYMEGLTFLGFIVNRMPDWDNAGFLVMLDMSLDKTPVRKYQDESLFLDVSWPQTRIDVNNCVEIIGLASQITKVVSPLQPLTEINGTIGYFEDQYKKRIYYTQDRQGRAQNVAIGDYQINRQLGGFGQKPRLQNTTEFSAIVIIDTPYQSYIFLVWLAVYISLIIAAAAVKSSIIGAAAEVTAAIWLAAGLYVMQQMGTFNVTIEGEPYKLVYKEIKGQACWSNLNEYEIRTKTIENHMVDSQTLADSLAWRELKKEAVKGAPRSLSLPFDPFLGKTDIIELPDGTRYMIKSISKTLKRGESIDMSVDALNVRCGLEYNNNAGFSLY